MDFLPCTHWLIGSTTAAKILYLSLFLLVVFLLVLFLFVLITLLLIITLVILRPSRPSISWVCFQFHSFDPYIFHALYLAFHADFTHPFPQRVQGAMTNDLWMNSRGDACGIHVRGHERHGWEQMVIDEISNGCVPDVSDLFIHVSFDATHTIPRFTLFSYFVTLPTMCMDRFGVEHQCIGEDMP